MPSPIPQNVIDAIEQTKTVEASAILFINGTAARIQAAIDAAIANGATAAELQPVQDQVDALKTQTQALSDALAANP